MPSSEQKSVSFTARPNGGSLKKKTVSINSNRTLHDFIKGMAADGGPFMSISDGYDVGAALLMLLSSQNGAKKLLKLFWIAAQPDADKYIQEIQERITGANKD